jgi:hypothetical protein
VLYELRKYQVMPGKMPALLDRFGSFTVPHWHARGFNLVGFWTADIGGANNELTYILGWESVEERIAKFGTWQASPERLAKWEETERDGPLVYRFHNLLMQPTAFSQLDQGIAYGPDAAGRAPYLFEWREYDAMPGKTAPMVKRFDDFVVGCFKGHGFRQVGYWTPLLGGHNGQLIYLLAWESHEERIRRFQEFQADPEWRRVMADTERGGPLVERIATQMLRPTAFSPLR